MNLRLSDQRIRATCRELLATRGRVSGRQLREALRERFGAAGKTSRVFQIWREETRAGGTPKVTATSRSPGAVVLPHDLGELRRRLAAAESAAAENLSRAERAEYREEAHQDHWAMEIDRARQAARNQPDSARIIRQLQEQVFNLSRELDAARGARPRDQ